MKKAFALILALTFFGCSDKVIEKPENLIPKDQMTEILYDLAIISAAKKINRSYLDNYKIKTMPFIYKKYGIDSVQFVQSDIYYASVPSEYEEMYQIVEARLEEEKQVFDEEKKQQNDSLRRQANEKRENLLKKNTESIEKDSLP